MRLETHTLVNPQNGNLAFKVFGFTTNNCFDHIQRNNYYSLIWVKKGSGKVKADFSEYEFENNALFAFSPYQPFMFLTIQILKALLFIFILIFFAFINIKKKLPVMVFCTTISTNHPL